MGLASFNVKLLNKTCLPATIHTYNHTDHRGLQSEIPIVYNCFCPSMPQSSLAPGIWMKLGNSEKFVIILTKQAAFRKLIPGIFNSEFVNCVA